MLPDGVTSYTELAARSWNGIGHGIMPDRLPFRCRIADEFFPDFHEAILAVSAEQAAEIFVSWLFSDETAAVVDVMDASGKIVKVEVGE